MPVEKLITTGANVPKILRNLFVVTMTFQKNLCPNLEYSLPTGLCFGSFLSFKRGKNKSFLFCCRMIKHLFLKIFVGLLYGNASPCYRGIKAPEQYQDVRFQSHCTNSEMCLPLISPLG